MRTISCNGATNERLMGPRRAYLLSLHEDEMQMRRAAQRRP